MLSHIYFVPNNETSEHYDTTMEYYDDNTLEYHDNTTTMEYHEDFANVSELNVSFDQPCEIQQCPCELGLNHLSSTPI